MNIANKYPVIIKGKKYKVSIGLEKDTSSELQQIDVTFIDPDQDPSCPAYVYITHQDTIDSYVRIIKEAANHYIEHLEMEERKRKKETLLKKELDLWNGVIETNDKEEKRKRIL